MDYATLKRRSVARLELMGRDLKESVAMKRSWNDNRPEEQPFDVGWELCLLAIIADELAAWERNDMPEIIRLGQRMAEHARTGE